MHFLKNNRLNDRDFNIDQNNRDYDFLHNRAALVCVSVCSSLCLPAHSTIYVQ